MKKFLNTVLLFLILFVVTGCGERKIECSEISDDKQEKLIATIKGNRIIKVDIEEIYEYEDTDELESEYSTYKSTLYLYRLIKGIDTNVTKYKKKKKTTVSLDLRKVNNTIIGDFLDLVDLTPDSLIKYAKSEGLTCN